MRAAVASLACRPVPAVAVDALTIRYDDLVAVDGLTFGAEAGEVTVVLGVNGAGKTSTIEAIEGFRRPVSGAIRVLGHDPIREHTALAPRLGVMLQGGGLHPAMRPLETLRLYASYYDRPEPPESLLERVGLADRSRTPVRHLSGGEQQRLSLALALVGRPDVALLDEPTAGVDVEGRQLIRAIVAELRERGACVLLTTHDLAEGERVADRVVVIDKGRLVGAGRLDELLTAEELRFEAPGPIDVGALSAYLGVTVSEEGSGSYRVQARSSPALLAALGSWLDDHRVTEVDVRSGRSSLEELFVRLTAADEADR